MIFYLHTCQGPQIEKTCHFFLELPLFVLVFFSNRAVKMSVELYASKALAEPQGKFACQLTPLFRTLSTESATAEFLSLPSYANKLKGLMKAAGVGEERCDNHGESPKRRERRNPVLECSRALSHLPLRCVAPLSAGRFLQLGNTEVDCASWSQLSVISREMTDQDQLLS